LGIAILHTNTAFAVYPIRGWAAQHRAFSPG
jgi:hypothetical protein